jgi:GxxExxY protein
VDEASDKDPRTYAIIGAAMEVHRNLGSGFLEAVYQEALAIELRLRGVPFRREVAAAVTYKGHPLGAPYRCDFVCHDEVLVELKAQTSVGGAEHGQVVHYLRATRLPIGLLINFGTPSLSFQRFVN